MAIRLANAGLFGSGVNRPSEFLQLMGGGDERTEKLA